jgi:hypothetical protein
MKKNEQIQSFINNAEIEITITLSCCLCGSSSVQESQDNLDDLDKCVERFYDDGWRDTTIKVHGLTGVMCPTCVKKRNDPKYLNGE